MNADFVLITSLFIFFCGKDWAKGLTLIKRTCSRERLTLACVVKKEIEFTFMACFNHWMNYIS